MNTSKMSTRMMTTMTSTRTGNKSGTDDRENLKYRRRPVFLRKLIYDRYVFRNSVLVQNFGPKCDEIDMF